LEIPTDYLDGIRKLLAEIRQREGISVTLGQYLIEEVVPNVESGDASALYTAISDLGKPFKERGQKIELDPEKDATIIEAAEMVFNARNSSEQTDENALGFYNSFNSFVEQRIRIVAEQEKLFTQYQELLSGGYAEEIMEGTGGILPAESLLESSGDERMWSDLSAEEKNQIRKLLQELADSKGMSLVEDEESCMVVPK
jgi:hypothetical protein